MSGSVLILGGDGFCGWPTALHLSAQGYDVAIVDNLSRRSIDDQLGASSLTPIASIDERLAAWRSVTGKEIPFWGIDIAADYSGFRNVVSQRRPDAIVHFAEQRSAPYSMKGVNEKNYTIDNNVRTTHHTLLAMVELGLDAHLVHLGTTGVYGYSTVDMVIAEGYLDVIIPLEEGRSIRDTILYPTQPGSIYHLTKSLDQLLFQFYAQNDRLRITDLHQGIVWGTQTAETRRHPALVNRFDYDGDYGTVLNRFLVEAAIGYPLTVHGTGGQTRGFINIQDTVRCVALALENPPAAGEKPRIFNQVAETKRVRDLAEMIAGMTGAQIAFVDNPRKEAVENELALSNQSFLDLGLAPILLEEQLFTETIEIVGAYKDRIDRELIPAQSLWTTGHRPGLVKHLKGSGS
ncbi:NAD-dependent epimerase/dehydratase family protein [Antarcticirhabdus aurantiaca]|uniref:NAD-dependent epimerase/dehydratase family protein n=1 Tax=Antarcticirhabdus aurantiaca TaxID=2606717 RepID=A0ACD4NMM0_9HYPH|nr:NAD-dependent epimerase/dehydratase family protein [Antarcticirhabdus aurantiaca]WAJ28165.1 NAD-dependent epimerase/dehydratase family protein [Jeongeuplla avenae]